MSNLKNARIRAGLSQSALAQQSGVNFRMLQNYEQGVKNIDGAKIETLAALARALDCGISEILENPDAVKNVRI
ncbi:MAG: helix-turn-helix transcriptional regulator [Clostridia bacterium]|nr:helix-turn-helix transcriptional regulator [Clostridia bacterium]